MTDDRPLVEQLLDVMLYAPIGAIVLASEQVPGLVSRGRSHVEGRVNVARMVGRMAVTTARRRADGAMSSSWSSRDSGDRDSQSGPEPAEAADTSGREESDIPGGSGSARKSTAEAPFVPSVESLAIPGYASLAASQVVQRLSGLNLEELDAVRRYEEATRGRRTILGRVAQLLGEAGLGA